MQAETKSPGAGRGASITGIVVAYGIKYLAGGLLAFTILATFAAVMFIYLTVVGEEMPWLAALVCCSLDLPKLQVSSLT